MIPDRRTLQASVRVTFCNWPLVVRDAELLPSARWTVVPAVMADRATRLPPRREVFDAVPAGHLPRVFHVGLARLVAADVPPERRAGRQPGWCGFVLPHDPKRQVFRCTQHPAELCCSIRSAMIVDPVNVLHPHLSAVLDPFRAAFVLSALANGNR